MPTLTRVYYTGILSQRLQSYSTDNARPLGLNTVIEDLNQDLTWVASLRDAGLAEIAHHCA